MGFGSLSVQYFQELYNVFLSSVVKSISSFLMLFFGSKCLHVIDLGLRVLDLEFGVILCCFVCSNPWVCLLPF